VNRPVATLGETMALFRSEQLGSLATVDEFRLSIGGAESNVAIGLARLGVPARWLGRIGADALGHRIVRELRGENIDVRPIIDPHAPTAVMVKENSSPGRTRVTYYRAGNAGSRLAPEDLGELDLGSASLLHVTGITPGLSPSASETVFAALDEAVRLGIPISFDVNHRDAVWAGRDPGPIYRRMAEHATIVFAGSDEAAHLTDLLADDDQARAIARLGPLHVVIKRGAHGATALIDGILHRQAAIQVPVVDTVGAGDAFVAGYLAEFLAGRGPQALLQMAVTTGAFACLSPGDWEGFPRTSELASLAQSDPVAR
jgi:2-dehydro-3-deoxygluconokinase